jgi:hypothetical protein
MLPEKINKAVALRAEKEEAADQETEMSAVATEAEIVVVPVTVVEIAEAAQRVAVEVKDNSGTYIAKESCYSRRERNSERCTKAA